MSGMQRKALPMTKRLIPVFPSARATVAADRYAAAVEALDDVPNVFLDNGAIQWPDPATAATLSPEMATGTILLPETATAAIELLGTHFDAVIEYGVGREWEFVRQADAAGVADRLVVLGNLVKDMLSISVEEMVRVAIANPEDTLAVWSSLYKNSLTFRDTQVLIETGKKHLNCPQCDEPISLDLVDGLVGVTCGYCGYSWETNPIFQAYVRP